jgi:hypothetical protein
MKSNNLLLMAVFLLAISTSAQSLGQDAEGNSTIVVPTTTLNLDITNSVATFSFYKELGSSNEKFAEYHPIIECELINTDKEMLDCIQKKLREMQTQYWNPAPTDMFNQKKKNHYYTVGIDLAGKTKEGLGTLFSKEKVTNSASIGFLTGYNWSNINYREHAADSIAKNFKQKLKLEDDIKNAEEKVTPALINAVNNATTVILDIPPIASLEGKIGYYESRIQIVNDLLFLKGTDKDNIKLLETKIVNLKLIDAALVTLLLEADKLEKLEAAKPIVDAEVLKQKKIIYDLYMAYKPLYAVEYKSELFKDPFDKKSWEAQKKTNDFELLMNQFKTVEIQKKPDGQTFKEIAALTAAYGDVLKALKAKQQFIENQKGSNVFTENTFLTNNLLYIKGTFTGAVYTYDLNNSATTIKERFVDKNFNGYTATLGYTRNFRSYNFVGCSLALNYTNNLSGLTSTTYKFETTVPQITGGEFSSSQEIIALSGVYDTFLRYDVNFDYIRLVPLKEDPGVDDKQSQIYLSINPYLRHRIYEHANDLTNNTIVGLGLHAYNSKDNKIMGGVFIQTNDLFGNHAGEDSTLGKRITFGVIAKFAFTGLKIEEKK